MARVQVVSLAAGSVTYKDGSAYSGARVTITDSPSGSLSTVYDSASGVGTLANPLTSNSEGELAGYLPTGQYTFTTAAGEVSDVKTVEVVAASDITGGGGSLTVGDTSTVDLTLAGSNLTAAVQSASITDTHVAGANKDGAAGTASMRTLGTGASQAAAGNDSRFSTGIPATIVDAKGDLIAAAAADTVARLPVVSNYQHLVSDTATSTGLRWRTGDYVRVKDYAVGDGTTDDTAAFQTAVDAAAAAGKPLFVDPGYTYRINGQVVVSTDNFRWVMPWSGTAGAGDTATGIGSKILCGNSSAPCLLFRSVAANMRNLFVDGLRVWAEGTRHRVPLVQFGAQNASDSIALADSHFRHLYADGQSFNTDGFLFHSVYNAGVSDSHTNRMGGVSWTVQTGAANVGNLGFRDCTAYHTAVGWLIKEYNSPTNLINSILLSNCKAYGETSPATHTFVSTTIAGTEAIGQTVITLASAVGISTGQWVTFVKANGQIVVDKIAGVSGADITITRSGGLPVALAAGDAAVVGNWHTVAGGPGNAALIIDNPHFEQCNGLLAAGLLGGEVRLPYLGNAVHRAFYAVREAQNIELVRPHSAFGTPIPTGAALLHQANHSSNARNSVRNANKNDWPAFADATADILRVDGGGPSYGGSRFGGVPTLLGIWRTETTVAASQTNIKMSGPDGTTTRYFTLPARGVLRAMLLRADSGWSAGSLTATVYISGVATSLVTTLNSGGAPWRFTDLTFSPDTFAAGDVIEVKWTTDGTWAPTANSLDVEVWVEM